MADLVKIKFLETRVVQDERTGSKFEERYEEGETYALSATSAERWIKRGAAEAVNDADVKSGKVHVPSVEKAPNAPGGAGGHVGGEGSGNDVPEVPADWRDLHFMKQIHLAKQFDAEVRTKDEAVAVLEKREKASA